MVEGKSVALVKEKGIVPLETQFPIAVYDAALQGTAAENSVAWSALSWPGFVSKTKLLKSTWTGPPVAFVVNLNHIELLAVKQKVKSSSQPGQNVLFAPLFVTENNWFGQSSRAELQLL